LAEQRRGRPHHWALDRVGEFLPGEGLGEPGRDDLLGDLFSRHAVQDPLWLFRRCDKRW
jgi:hypothetical protein